MENLPHQQISVAARVLIENRNGFEATCCIKRRRLKIERHQDDVPATAPARFLLGRDEQTRSKSLLAPRLFDPKLANLKTPAPGVARDPGDDPLLLVPREDREPVAVCN